ncbi:DEAD/DEAH box helicase [Roseivirga seohaensis]|uniref:DEAD/DEAH box helicase n=1 Tax=Roseivirga seohaensis TaxID=1914963 RepID=UPI003BAD7106
MSIFSNWTGEIILPEIAIAPITIGGNTVTRLVFPGLTQKVELFESNYDGFDLIKTSLAPPFQEILLRQPKKRTTPPAGYTVLKQKKSSANIDLSSQLLKWEKIDINQNSINSPSDILKSWKRKFTFQEEDEEQGIDGLRPPQIGALHAIVAYFAVHTPKDYATVVLPTGTGKTETMLSALVYKRLNKLLVIVPSNALRDQVGGKFSSLGILPQIGVVPPNIARPYVTLIKKGIADVGEALEIIEKTNVIVATPNVLKASNEQAVETLAAHCSDLFIDEAHHSPASSWEKIRLLFEGKKITQFTATPFRNDKQHIGGKIIFNYRLGDAQAADYYKRIRLMDIEEWGDTRDCDIGIAKKAIEVLKSDREAELDHIVMARADKIGRAEEILKIYQDLAPEFNPILVNSRFSKKAINKGIEQIMTRESRIVVCVDMLGEGFDLANLKIAAIHDGHKSLAITLQFIGRFTRKAQNVGNAAVVVNVADPKTQKKLEELYAQGADWDDLIQRLSEDRINDELSLQEIIENLKKNGDLSDQISLWNLRPNLTAQIYQTECDSWNPEDYKSALPSDFHHWHSLSEEDNLLIVMGVQESAVKWGSHQELKDTMYKLLIAYWNQENQALFIYSNDYKAFRVEKIAQDITNDQTVLLSGSRIFNILNNVQLPLVKNLGASKVGAISFTQYFGSNVTDGLADIEKSQSELSNIACLGYEEGERVIWGGSQRRGKVWSVTTGSIEYWIAWCERTWEKVSAGAIDEDNITRDFLRPNKLTSAHTEQAISVQWGEHIQSKREDKVKVYFGENLVPLYLVDLDIVHVDPNSIHIQISSEHYQSVYQFEIGTQYEAGYSYSLINGSEVAFQLSDKAVIKPLAEHVMADPFILRYADGTHSYNNYHIDLKMEADMFPQNSLETWNWGDIPLNAESMGRENDTNTIQYFTYQKLEREYQVIFNDDAKGEAADLVCLKEIDDKTIELCLVHCKNAKGGTVSGDIDNMYTVCGQAQKSIRWKHMGLAELETHLRRRNKQWQDVGASRILKGDLKTLAYLKNKSRQSKIQFRVMIVQPGLGKSIVSDDILRLLGNTELYLKKTTEADFHVICSE